MTLLILALAAAFLIVCGIGALVAVVGAITWSIILCVKVLGVLLVFALLFDVFTIYKGGTIENYE